MWCGARKRAVPEVIRCGDITNCVAYGSRKEAFKAFKELSESFLSSRNLLRSDGPVLENGTLKTRARALLTTEGVLEILRGREESRAAEQERRTARQADVLLRRAACEEEAAVRLRVREDSQRAHINHTVWLGNRGMREVTRAQFRGFRRWAARQRALCAPSIP